MKSVLKGFHHSAALQGRCRYGRNHPLVLGHPVAQAIRQNDWMCSNQRALVARINCLGSAFSGPRLSSYRQTSGLATENSGRRPASWSVQRIYNPPEGLAFADGVQFPRLPLFLAALSSVSRAQAENLRPATALISENSSKVMRKGTIFVLRWPRGFVGAPRFLLTL